MMRKQKESFKLSILLVTYNHELYIRQALEALFGQEIEGPVQIVVADDDSSDGTLGIIREYDNKDSRFHFKYLDSVPNLGITKNYQRGFAACSGRYIAVLEGDDYWISPAKLQRQCKFLDAHWECNLCAVNYYIYEENKSHFYLRTHIERGHRLLTAREIIFDNLPGNFSCCMYRKDAVEALPPQVFDIKAYDWIINICVARKSLIGFLDEPMSVYRLHSAGFWTKINHIEKLKEQLEVISVYDALTEHVFHADFNVLASQLRQEISVSSIKSIAKTRVRLRLGITDALLGYLPPLVITIFRAFMPPAIKRKIKCSLSAMMRGDAA
ncbi:MAG: glycosyltransferase [Legionella sp.]|nr:glycosyltransferase [Legionella sp.]